MRQLLNIAIILIGFTLTGCSFSLAADVTPPPGYQAPEVIKPSPVSTGIPLYPLVPPNPTDGEAIFTEKCAPCHGQSGHGDGARSAQLANPPPPIGSADLARLATPAQWYSIVTNGNLERFMPPFASLSDRQRWDVVAYAFSLSQSPLMLTKGAELYQIRCAECHGETGKGDGPKAKQLSSPPQDLTVQAYMADKSSQDWYQVITNGVGPGMPAFGNSSTEEERWLLTDYLRWLSFSHQQVAETNAADQKQGETPEATSVVQNALVTPGAGGAVQSLEVPQEVTASITLTQEVGLVTGIVTNATGGQVPIDLVVQLAAFDNMDIVMTRTTELQPGGLFTFTNIEMPEGRVFIASVENEGVTFTSDVIAAQPGDVEIKLPVKIYETTSDTSDLIIDRLHLFFEPVDDQTMRVVELYIVSNLGDRTVMPTDQAEPLLKFKLPKEAKNLEFQNGVLGGRYIEMGDGFGDLIEINPGMATYQNLFSYELPYDGKKLEIAQPVMLPINAVVVLVPEGGLKVKSDSLQDAGMRDAQGTQYHMYNGGTLNAGQELRVSISGKLADNPDEQNPLNSGVVVGLAALGVTLIAAGVVLYWRGRASIGQSKPPESKVPVMTTNESIETLMDAILALDDLYQSGQLPEDAYQQRRADLKMRLKDLMDKKK